MVSLQEEMLLGRASTLVNEWCQPKAPKRRIDLRRYVTDAFYDRVIWGRHMKWCYQLGASLRRYQDRQMCQIMCPALYVPRAMKQVEPPKS